MQLIPLRSDIWNYTFNIVLDGVNYNLSFRYNTRAATWAMDVQDSSGNNIVMGVPLLMGVDLLKQYSDSRLPPGNLFLVNNKEIWVEAGQFDLGTDVVLMYQEAGSE